MPEWVCAWLREDEEREMERLIRQQEDFELRVQLEKHTKAN